MADSFNKKDREKKRQKRKKEKAERKEQRKAEGKKGNDIMYVDEFGNLTPTPPDPKRKSKIKAEDIEISIPKKSEMDEFDHLRQGTVKFFNTDKGYGFIIDAVNGDSYFTHINNTHDPIKEGDKVVFEVGSGPKGPVALDVRLQ